MLFHKRTSFFPFLVALLSLGLLVFMFYAFSYKSGSFSSKPSPVVAISSDEYRASVKELASAFDQKMADASDVMTQRVVVEQTLTALLALRVPVEYQSTHLQLALALNSMKDGLASQNVSIDAALAQWQAAVSAIK